MADSIKQASMIQASNCEGCLYRRHFKKVHWCYLSTESANVPENIIPQAYWPSAVSLVWGIVKEPDKHLAVWTLLTAPGPMQQCNKQVVTTNVESWKKATQTNQYRSQSSSKFASLFGTIHRSNLALFMLISSVLYWIISSSNIDELSSVSLF